MPRYEERQQPSNSRRPSDRRGAVRGRDRTPAKKVEYVKLFTLFGSEHNGGRLQVDIRPYIGKDGSIEDHLTIDEFLFFCEKLYYGEPLTDEDSYGCKLTGSLWEMDEPTKEQTHSGNIRFSDEQLAKLKAEYKRSQGEDAYEEPAPVNAKRKAPVKPAYVMPDEEEEEEYEEISIAPSPKAKRQPRELDMETEVVGETYAPY